MEVFSILILCCGFIVMEVLNFSSTLARSLEQPRYDTAYACEGKTLKIECNEGEIIHLIRANYGRFSITICNDHGNTEWSVNCMSPKSLRVLHTKCSQQQNCSILATTSMFGDPCPGTLKYLEAHYQCMPAATTTATSRPSPPWLITSPPSVWNTAKSVTLRPPLKMPTSTERSTTIPLLVVNTSTTSNNSFGTQTSVPAAPPSEVEEVLVPHSTSSLPPSALPPSWKTTHWLTTASSTSVLDYTPSPSITWLQENELVLCSPTSARNLYWNWTQAGEVNVQPCPGGATGLARWRCVVLKPLTLSSPPTVSWLPDTPDLSECRSLWLTNLESRVEEGDSIISISNDLSQVTSSKTLYGGDMMTTTKIIKKMAQKMAQDIQTFPDPRQREAIVTELLHGVVVTGSNLLDSSQHPSWLDLSHKEQMRVATSLLMGLEENAFLLADTVIREKTVIQNVKNILLSVRVVETRNVGTEQFPSPTTYEHWQDSQDWLQIPRGALLENSEGGLVRLVFVAFNRLEEILQPHSDPSTVDVIGENGEVTTGIRTARNTTRVLNSKVISASLGKGRHIALTKPVRLSLRHLRTENVSNPSCVFWDFTISAWSEEGCHVEDTNFTHTLCQCNHLTNFAVLMDIHSNYLSPRHQVALQIITYVGCIISVVCLVLAIITFQLFRGLKSDRTIIHKNLCICLLVAELLFLAGIGQTDKPVMCGIVAGLLHFFFLCAFGWMFLEGFQLYVMLIEVFEVEKSRIRWYYCFAYGVPLIIVAVSCVVDPFSYGTDKYCWLRADNFFIFSFVGPVIVVILANLVFLSMAIFMMCRHANASASMKSKEHSRLSSARTWLRGAIVLVFLLGLTWTFGLLYLNEESALMAYTFTVLNSLQGLFIFVFHCVQNEKVHKEYRKFIRRHSWLPKCLRCSKHSHNKERHSSLYAGSNGNPSAPNSHSTDSSALSPHGTSYFLQLGWNSPGSNQVKSNHTVTAPALNRVNASLTNAISNSSDPEVEVCVATLPYVRGRGILPSNLPKSATTWGPLHKPLIWKNIPFKSCSQDSEHGCLEQEISPRCHSTTTLYSLNNQRNPAKIKDTHTQAYNSHDYNQGITNDLSDLKQKNEHQDPNNSLQCNRLQTSMIHLNHTNTKALKKANGNLLRSISPWNHTYTEIRDGRLHNANHLHVYPTAPLEDDPVYEEIEHSEVHGSDMSDDDGKRQSDVSRQSSRSYGDHHPLIPYSPATDRNFHSCLDVALKQRLKEQSHHQYGVGANHSLNLAPTSYFYSGENAHTVAVLDGETVVCHLQSNGKLFPENSCNSRTMVLPTFGECSGYPTYWKAGETGKI